MRSVGLKKRYMTNGKKINFEVGSIWYDSAAMQEYVILEIDEEDFITLLWLDTNASQMHVPKYYCEDDRFIRMISSLELELL